MKSTLKIMIVAGEASGDLHAAKLVQALRDAANDDIVFFGCAGPNMRDAGVESIVKADSLSIVGLPEIARSLPMFLRAFRELRDAAIQRRPDVVVLVDFPEFNLKLARSLKQAGFKVVYYISPQLWAWRKYRVRTIRKFVDLLLTILPFESAWYRKNKVEHVRYVGSPLANQVHAKTGEVDFCQSHNLDSGRPIVSLLPGSRQKEIARIFPLMLETAALLAKRSDELQFVVALGSDSALDEVNAIVSARQAAKNDLPQTFLVIQGETYDALNASDAAAVTSGTATLETGILGTPMAIVYKTSAINYRLLRPLISVEHFGLINLIAGKRVAAEMIQDEFTPETLANEILRILSPEVNQKIRTELRTAAEKLGPGGASKRAAQAILDLLGR